MSPMMPERPGGKSRSFGRGILFMIVTLGLYALYWHYKAYKELEDEFPRRVDFPLGLYLSCYIPFVNWVTQFLYMSNFIADVNELRYSRDLPRKLTLGSFLAWYILGAFILVGPFVAYYKLQSSINDLWTTAAVGQTVPGTADRSVPSDSRALSSPGSPKAETPVGKAPKGRPTATHQEDQEPESESMDSPAPPPSDHPIAEGDEAGIPEEPAYGPVDPATTPPAEVDASGETDTDDEPVPGNYEPHACSACGEETEIPPKRPLRLTCPSCGTKEVLRNGS